MFEKSGEMNQTPIPGIGMRMVYWNLRLDGRQMVSPAALSFYP